MRKFQTVMFLIAMVIASTQMFRHIYIKWIVPTESVLDQFRSETESNIAEANTLKELIPLYANAKAAVDEYESDLNSRKVVIYQRSVTEPYKTEQTLKKAIKLRETKRKQVTELIFYWVGGLVSALFGMLIYRRINTWIGMSGILVGFSEMIFWTSPLSQFINGREFAMLLNLKIGMSVATLVLLILVWLVSSKQVQAIGRS